LSDIGNLQKRPTLEGMMIGNVHKSPPVFHASHSDDPDHNEDGGSPSTPTLFTDTAPITPPTPFTNDKLDVHVFASIHPHGESVCRCGYRGLSYDCLGWHFISQPSPPPH
jgi:hypothetical protein